MRGFRMMKYVGPVMHVGKMRNIQRIKFDLENMKGRKTLQT
jgi:hypothetical protein